MSRSGYHYDCDEWALIRWRGAVASAIRGRRGQALLRELLAALDAMPEPGLISDALATEDGEVCALGAVAQRRGMPVLEIDSNERLAADLGIAEELVCEIAFMNDENYGRYVTPRQRWERMRAWVIRHLRDAESAIAGAAPGEPRGGKRGPLGTPGAP